MDKEIERRLAELEGRIRTLANYDQELLDNISQVARKLNDFVSKCNEFEKQRFFPMREMVNCLWAWSQRIPIEEKQRPTCTWCKGTGRL